MKTHSKPIVGCSSLQFHRCRQAVAAVACQNTQKLRKKKIFFFAAAAAAALLSMLQFAAAPAPVKASKLLLALNNSGSYPTDAADAFEYTFKYSPSPQLLSSLFPCLFALVSFFSFLLSFSFFSFSFFSFSF